MVAYRWQLRMVAVVGVVGLALGACSDDKKKNPTEPEPGPEVPTVVQTFQGDVAQNTRVCKGFSMNNPGTIVMEIVELMPLRTITMGMSLGQPDASNPSGCSSFAEDSSVRIFQTFASAGLQAGSYCTCVYDVGNIFPGETVSYTQEVEHPE